MLKLLVTGSSGLIGSEVCLHFASLGWEIHGVDNNQRAVFFGSQGDTRWNQQRLQTVIKGFVHHEVDIRDRQGVLNLIDSLRPDAIVHTAAQPSHDLAAKIPFDQFTPNAPFVHLSTNKVYGDAPNEIPMLELDSRWDYADPNYENGIPETFRIDQSKHSLFGASKVASDVMVQEYGRYFGLKTCCLRGGCLTGPNHSGVELHGFLSYLVKSNLEERTYKIYGYKGKQVRDNIHSYDVARFIEEFINNPRCGEVYNLGGGKNNTCSILEAFDIVAALSGKPMQFEYVDKNREGDHICYYSDLRKMQQHYPEWSITKSLTDIFTEITEAWRQRLL
jgi:CDP-paratose 2-epimerase